MITWLEILYSDQFIVVVNKPEGLLSVPGKGPGKQDCLANRIRDMFDSSIRQPSVHRLDMDTSGIMVFALTKEVHRDLSIQFQDRRIKKQYIAILEGVIENDSGEINIPLRVDLTNRPYQIYDPVHGRSGITLWEKIEVAQGRTRVLFTPLTGRTHQLRVHASHPMGLGCPIVGDRLYGHVNPEERLMLHASSLTFTHPVQNKVMCFQSIPLF
ncbi:MAG: RluA family pseudouridine synthase [Deltaproteobacteria bacterium]|jgi:tRNA pseudouridine32 synthase/23S rRNA pseudouridine746 synthase|nr:RluA family pseudouridine synthase [Deltaproteobacteria bacterium]